MSQMFNLEYYLKRIKIKSKSVWKKGKTKNSYVCFSLFDKYLLYLFKELRFFIIKIYLFQVKIVLQILELHFKRTYLYINILIHSIIVCKHLWQLMLSDKTNLRNSVRRLKK